MNKPTVRKCQVCGKPAVVIMGAEPHCADCLRESLKDYNPRAEFAKCVNNFEKWGKK
jgi:hypothetical protein